MAQKTIKKQGNSIVVTDKTTGDELFDHVVSDTYSTFTVLKNGEAVVDLKGLTAKEKINTFKVAELENEDGDSFSENNLGLVGAKEYLRGLLGFKRGGSTPTPVEEMGIMANHDFTNRLHYWTDTNNHWQSSSNRAYHPPTSNYRPLSSCDKTIIENGLTYNIELHYEVVSGGLRVASASDIVIITDLGSGVYTTTYTNSSGSDSELLFARNFSDGVGEFYIDKVIVTEV